MAERGCHIIEPLALLDELVIADDMIGIYSTDYGVQTMTRPDGGMAARDKQHSPVRYAE